MKYTPLRAGFIGVVSVVIVSSLKQNTRNEHKRSIKALEEGAAAHLVSPLPVLLVGFVVGHLP